MTRTDADTGERPTLFRSRHQVDWPQHSSGGAVTSPDSEESAARPRSRQGDPATPCQNLDPDSRLRLIHGAEHTRRGCLRRGRPRLGLTSNNGASAAPAVMVNPPAPILGERPPHSPAPPVTCLSICPLEGLGGVRPALGSLCQGALLWVNVPPCKSEMEAETPPT